MHKDPHGVASRMHDSILGKIDRERQREGEKGNKKFLPKKKKTFNTAPAWQKKGSAIFEKFKTKDLSCFI